MSLTSNGSLAALALLSLADPSSAFMPSMSPSRTPSCSAVRMVAQSGSGSSASAIDRLSFLRVAGGSLAAAVALHGAPAVAKTGDYAKQDYSGTGGDSQSGLGKNDLPAAGKIDPWDNREKANQEYRQRVSSDENISERRAKAVAQKEKVFARLLEEFSKSDDDKSWKAAADFLNVQTLDLRRSMHAVSTRGARAVSAVMKGGDPEKPLTKLELAEKAFLATMNKLSISLNGERNPVKWDKAAALLQKGQKDWDAWVTLDATE